MRTTRRRTILAAVTGLALAIPIAATVTPAVAAPVASVRINEVEQNGDVNDWIEIVNTGTEAVDVSGWVLKDNDDTRTLAIAVGTTLAAGAYLAIDVDAEVPGKFGLGRADTARLFMPDGITLVDSYAWTDHAAVTFGRCADSTGEFGPTVASTKGAANACVVSAVDSVRINEIESSGGTPVDWIELTNIAKVPVDVSGLVLRDDKDASIVTIAAGSTIAPGGFLAIDVDVLGGFGLGSADTARLFLADGTTLVDSHAWTAHATTTYGRYPDGTGAFVTTAAATKGTANQRVAPQLPSIRVNEVESSGGTPGDWIELVNAGSTAVDISGWTVKDSDDAHASVIPAATTIAAGGYYIVEEAALGFGLGAADSARVFAADGFTLVDSRSWTAHATTTFGICGTDFTTTTSPTKGAVNDCGSPVRINEIESTGGTPGDWIELKNNGGQAADVSGYVLKDNDDSHAFVVPANTTVAAGGYYVADVEAAFGLGGADTARLYLPDATTLVDSHGWSTHATTTYGRCADGTGAFAATAAPTKGAVNACAGDLVTTPWPGAGTVATEDVANTFDGNMSGLAYEAAANGNVLWAAKNGTGALYRLVDNGTNWVPDTANGWSAGKVLHYADGTGDVDAEGVALTSAGAAGGVYISSERDNNGGGSRLSVLRYDVASAGPSLNATREWNLTADLPIVGANAGLEGIAWVPDAFLVSEGLRDESTKAAYDPATYPDHGTGLFFVGLEANGAVYAYALNQTSGGYTRVAAIASGFPGVMDLEFDAATGSLWAVCDDTCNGRSATLEVGADGRFAVTRVYERPTGVANLNNEGFAMAPQTQCVAGARSVFWADDSNTAGHSIRSGSLNCATAPVPGEPGVPSVPTVPSVPVPGNPAPTPVNVGATTPVAASSFTEAARGTVSAPSEVRPGQAVTITVGAEYAGTTVNVWMHSTPVLLGTVTVSAAGTVRVVIPADATAGAHRIAVLAADGTLIGWDNVTVAASARALASTGADVQLPVAAGLLLLLSGGLLLALRRAGLRRSVRASR